MPIRLWARLLSFDFVVEQAGIGEGRVAAEPGELLFGVDACVFLDALDGHGQGHGAVEGREQFFVAHGVERVKMAEMVDAARLLNKACINHGVDAAVDSVEQLGALHRQMVHLYVERTLFGLPRE